MSHEITTDHHHAFWSDDDEGWLRRHLSEMEAEGWRVVSVALDQSTADRGTPVETYWVMTKE